MRRATTPPYSHWRTVKPVKFKTYNKKFRLVTVQRRYKSEDWWPAGTGGSMVSLNISSTRSLAVASLMMGLEKSRRETTQRLRRLIEWAYEMTPEEHQ